MQLLLYFMLLLFSMSTIAQHNIEILPNQASSKSLIKAHLPQKQQLASLITKPADYDEATGKRIYEETCATCHRDGLAGAPKFRDANDWKPRLVNKTLDELVATADKGLNAMPQKGTCTSCSDADIKNAIFYMLPQS